MNAADRGFAEALIRHLFVRAQVNGIRFDDTVVRGGNAPLGVLPRNVDAYLRAAARSSASEMALRAARRDLRA